MFDTRTRCAAPAVLIALLAASAALAGDKARLAALDLRGEQGISEGTVRLLNELLLSELQATELYEVFGASDLASMMSLEEQRVKVTGCADDSCLAEIGGALGVQYLVASSVGQIGENFLINVKLLDVSRAKVAARATEVVKQQQTLLVEAMRRAVARVAYPALGKPVPVGSPSAAGAAAAGGGEPAAGSEPATLATEADTGPGLNGMEIGAIAAVCLTGAAAITAGVLGGLALADQKDMDSLRKDDPEWADTRDAVKGKALGADVLFGVAGAAGVTALLLYLLAPDDAAPAAAVAPTRGGAVLVVGGRFGRGW